MDSFDEISTPSRVWDVYLLPLGIDLFAAQPVQVTHLVAVGKTSLDANQSADVLRVARKRGLYCFDTVLSGQSSALLRQIAANARAAADAAGRDEWERGETSAMVRNVVGSRPLGSG